MNCDFDGTLGGQYFDAFEWVFWVDVNGSVLFQPLIYLVLLISILMQKKEMLFINRWTNIHTHAAKL
jgi:hypothetical protein